MDIREAVKQYRRQSAVIWYFTDNPSRSADAIREGVVGAEVLLSEAVHTLCDLGMGQLVQVLADETYAIRSILDGGGDLVENNARLAAARLSITKAMSAEAELEGGVQRGFPAYVYTGSHHSPNGGISATVNRVTVLTVHGVTLDQEYRIAAPEAIAPAVHIVSRGNGYLAAIPTTPVPAGHVGGMASGAQIHNSDSRWSDLVGRSVVYLHDRIETTEQYATLSD